MTQSTQIEESTKHMRLILVVEDDATVAGFVEEVLLDEEQFRVQLVETADDAMKFLNENAADVSLMLTDVRMPGSMDGIELANLVAKTWPAIPIVVMSGHGTPGSDELPPEVLFIPKPWTINRLLDGIYSTLEAASTSLSSASANVIP